MKAQAQKLGQWALARAEEKSTWVGLATLAAAFGFSNLSAQVGQVGIALMLILGGGMAAATTSSQG